MIDPKAIGNAIDQAFAETVSDFFDECQNQLEEVRWSWPRRTQTKARGVKTSPREISDTGELKRSGSVAIEPKLGRLVWSADHASLVYLGSVTANGTILPPRPWGDAALEEIDLAKTMAKHLAKRL